MKTIDSYSRMNTLVSNFGIKEATHTESVSKYLTESKLKRLCDKFDGIYHHKLAKYTKVVEAAEKAGVRLEILARRIRRYISDIPDLSDWKQAEMLAAIEKSDDDFLMYFIDQRKK